MAAGDQQGCKYRWPNHRNSDFLGLEGTLGFPTRHNHDPQGFRQKASKTVNDQLRCKPDETWSGRSGS